MGATTAKRPAQKSAARRSANGTVSRLTPTPAYSTGEERRAVTRARSTCVEDGQGGVVRRFYAADSRATGFNFEEAPSGVPRQANCTRGFKEGARQVSATARTPRSKPHRLPAGATREGGKVGSEGSKGFGAAPFKTTRAVATFRTRPERGLAPISLAGVSPIAATPLSAATTFAATANTVAATVSAFAGQEKAEATRGVAAFGRQRRTKADESSVSRVT